MERDLGKVARRALIDALPTRPPGMHLLFAGDGFRAYDCVCRPGAHSGASIGAYAHARAGVELAGAFEVRSSLGEALLVPSALLLGNAGGAFEFHHIDDGGDRSLVFEYDAAFLDEIAPGPFRRTSVPGSQAAVALAYEALRDGDADALGEAALAIAGAGLADARRSTRLRSSAHSTSVARAVRYVEAHSASDCSLATLAREARLTRYHFLRLFTATTGRTPRQHVIATRLRRAAIALRATRKPVTEIAFEVGFGDLSHFTHSFVRTFAVSPRTLRLQRHRLHR